MTNTYFVSMRLHNKNGDTLAADRFQAVSASAARRKADNQFFASLPITKGMDPATVKFIESVRANRARAIGEGYVLMVRKVKT